MKFCKQMMMLFLLVVAFFGQLNCMPGMQGTESSVVGTKSAVEQQTLNDLATLYNYSSVSGRFGVLNSILSYAGNEAISSEVQVEFYRAVQNFDKFARTYKLSKSEVAQMDKFFKLLQVSNLVYQDVAVDVAQKVSYWDRVAKMWGLKPYQRAIQRKRNYRK